MSSSTLIATLIFQPLRKSVLWDILPSYQSIAGYALKIKAILHRYHLYILLANNPNNKNHSHQFRKNVASPQNSFAKLLCLEPHLQCSYTRVMRPDPARPRRAQHNPLTRQLRPTRLLMSRTSARRRDPRPIPLLCHWQTHRRRASINVWPQCRVSFYGRRGAIVSWRCD